MSGTGEIVRVANSIVMLMCLFRPAVPAGRPITVVPLLKQRAGASGTAGPSGQLAHHARARRHRVASRPWRRPAPTQARTGPRARTPGPPSHEPSHRRASSSAPPCPARPTHLGGSRQPARATTGCGAAGGGGHRGDGSGGDAAEGDNGSASRRTIQRRGATALCSATSSLQ